MEITIIILCVAFIAAVLYLRTARGRGWLGELRVRLILGRTKQGEKYVFNDFMFVCDGKSVQIDHIVINKNGVFVIETKNYSGRIYGSDAQKFWLQTLAYGKVKNQLYSPVRQNARHTYKLGKVLGNDVFLNSVVIFVQNNTQHVRSDTVIPIRALESKLALPCKIKPYTPAEMQEIYGKLLSVRNTDITAREHIEQINETRELIEHNICPYCGKTLVTRQGKYGQLLGCSGYPECTFIKK